MVSKQTLIRLKHHRKSIQNQTKKTFTVYFPPPEIQPPHHLQNPFTTSLPNHIRKPYLNTHTYQATRRLPVNQSPLTQQPTNPICQSWPPLKHHTSCQKSQPPQPTNHKQKKKKEEEKKERKKEPTQAISHQPRPTNQPSAAATQQPPAADPSATTANTIFARPPPLRTSTTADARPETGSCHSAAVFLVLHRCSHRPLAQPSITEPIISSLLVSVVFFLSLYLSFF